MTKSDTTRSTKTSARARAGIHPPSSVIQAAFATTSPTPPVTTTGTAVAVPSIQPTTGAPHIGSTRHQDSLIAPASASLVEPPPTGADAPFRDRYTTPPNWAVDIGTMAPNTEHPLLAALRGQIGALDRKTTRRSMEMDHRVSRLKPTNPELMQRLIGDEFWRE